MAQQAGSKPPAIFEEPIVTAGIFADGATAGDPALLRRLILRRCNMLQSVEAALEMLSDAGRGRCRSWTPFRKARNAMRCKAPCKTPAPGRWRL
jgi:hypothetical protein